MKANHTSPTSPSPSPPEPIEIHRGLSPTTLAVLADHFSHIFNPDWTDDDGEDDDDDDQPLESLYHIGDYVTLVGFVEDHAERQGLFRVVGRWHVDRKSVRKGEEEESNDEGDDGSGATLDEDHMVEGDEDEDEDDRLGDSDEENIPDETGGNHPDDHEETDGTDSEDGKEAAADDNDDDDEESNITNLFTRPGWYYKLDRFPLTGTKTNNKFGLVLWHEDQLEFGGCDDSDGDGRDSDEYLDEHGNYD